MALHSASALPLPLHLASASASALPLPLHLASALPLALHVKEKKVRKYVKKTPIITTPVLTQQVLAQQVLAPPMLAPQVLAPPMLAPPMLEQQVLAQQVLAEPMLAPPMLAQPVIAAYHPHIAEQLRFFLQTEKIPNIIFYGPNGSGKRTIVHNFVSEIYKHNKTAIKTGVLQVNCAHGKGIKFVREELKFFAKTHINLNDMAPFKIVILSNADNLTPDAQSAMRRCIELFSHTTRFFLIVENKYKLLKPILSRLSDIYVASPDTYVASPGNLYQHALQQTYAFSDVHLTKRAAELRARLAQPPMNGLQVLDCAQELYEAGFSGLDLLRYIEDMPLTLALPLALDSLPPALDSLPQALASQKYQRLITFQRMKKEFRHERLFMALMLYFVFVRSDQPLENISFM